MATVRAAVKVDIERTELREFPWPSIPADAGLLKVESCGVGGSEPETYRKPNHAPCILGHELVGTIAEVGSIAQSRWGVQRGDLVALEEYLPCWHCEWCLRGDFRLCMEADFFNIKDRFRTPRFGMYTCEEAPHLWGGFAEHAYLPPNTVMHRVPENLSPQLATLAIPFGNGVQWACLDGGAGPGKSVLVFGPGQQGLGCVFAAKSFGAAQVILVGMTRDRARLDLALKLGADITVDMQQDDLKKAVMTATGGRGVDVVVDTTGDPTGQIVTDAIALAAKGAWLSLNGLEQVVPVGEIKKRYLTVRSPRGHSFQSIELALKCLSLTKLPVDLVCSHDYGLTDVDLAIKATAGRVVVGAIHVTVSPWRK